MHREDYRKILEHGLHTGLRPYGQGHGIDLVECVRADRSFGRRIGLEIRHILHKGKADLSPLHHIGKEVMNRKSARNHIECALGRRRSTFVDKLVDLIIQRECQHVITSCKKLQLVTSETELSRIIICSAHYKSLRDHVALVSQGHLDLGDILEVLQL